MAWGAHQGLRRPGAVSSSGAGLPFAECRPSSRTESRPSSRPSPSTHAHVPFTQVEEKTAPFTLRRFLAPASPRWPVPRLCSSRP